MFYLSTVEIALFKKLYYETIFRVLLQKIKCSFYRLYTMFGLSTTVIIHLCTFSGTCFALPVKRHYFTDYSLFVFSVELISLSKR